MSEAGRDQPPPTAAIPLVISGDYGGCLPPKTFQNLCAGLMATNAEYLAEIGSTIIYLESGFAGDSERVRNTLRQFVKNNPAAEYVAQVVKALGEDKIGAVVRRTAGRIRGINAADQGVVVKVTDTLQQAVVGLPTRILA